MIQIDSYYRVDTRYGLRTVKCLQFDSDGNPYGIFSPSDFESDGDNEGMVIPEGSPEATQEEATAWDNWYN